MVESARLESVSTPKGYRGFESPPLRQIFLTALKDGCREVRGCARVGTSPCAFPCLGPHLRKPVPPPSFCPLSGASRGLLRDTVLTEGANRGLCSEVCVCNTTLLRARRPSPLGATGGAVRGPGFSEPNPLGRRGTGWLVSSTRPIVLNASGLLGHALRGRAPQGPRQEHLGLGSGCRHGPRPRTPGLLRGYAHRLGSPAADRWGKSGQNKWWWEQDSNLCRPLGQQIYSLPSLTA